MPSKQQDQFLNSGLVLKSTGSFYWVKDEQGQVVQCKVRGKFRIKGIKSTNPIAVGDRVYFKLEDQNEIGTIERIFDRKNMIVRRSVNLSKQTQILAANIDMAYLVVTLSIPETTTMFIDRFLVSAQAYRIPVTILFNKMDLYQEADLDRVDYLKALYEHVGYPCLEISAHSKLNIDQLKASMANKTTVFVGHSGVGKSSLIKAVNPDISLKISQISNIHLTGRHTTTFAEMYEWQKDSYIADTPGIKAFGLDDFSKEELSHYFPEIFEVSHHCKYQNCTHSHEPSCAVREAVEEGIIPESRFYNYTLMLEDDLAKHR